jgi:hypothetical protein
MPKVRLSVEVSEDLLRGFQAEARRRGDTPEHLLEHTVQLLLEDMEEEERQPPDPSIVMP